MWTTRGLPITPFLNQFMRIAKSEGYRYILLLVARPADEYTLYENLYRDWKSLNELTGTEIMFLFVGPDAGRTDEMAGFIGEGSEGEELFFSPYIAGSGKERYNPRSRRSEWLSNGHAIGTLTDHVSSPRQFEQIAHSHEAQIKELRQRFSLKEVELPALVLIKLASGEEFASSVRGVTSLYPLLQCLVDEVEEFEKLKTRSDNPFEKKISINYHMAVSTLSTATISPDSPLADLQSLLLEAPSWGSPQFNYKTEQLRKCLYRIKADSSCEWFYRQHRGLIQSVVDLLNSGAVSNVLGSGLTGDELLSSEQGLLTRALDQHASIYYRDDAAVREHKMDRVDVFVSYSRRDLEMAKTLEEHLTQIGYKVWRDDAVRAGFAFRSEIRSALSAAKVVVVLWTKNSINSEWVEWEATFAQRRVRYLPVSDGTVDELQLPAPFGNFHLIPLADWKLVERNVAQFVNQHEE